MATDNFTVDLTPGYVWQPGEVWTADKANLAANPTINVNGSFSGQTLGPGSVVLSNLTNGMFTADASGRAPFANGWLTVGLVASGTFTADATGRGPFANGWLSLALVGSGIFTADTPGRAPFAGGWLDAALVQPDAYWYAVATGTSSAYVVGFTPALNAYMNGGSQAFTSYWDGLVVSFRAPATCLAAVTLNAGLGVAGIYRANGTAVIAGDILSASIVEVRWNATFNSNAGGWQLITPPAGANGQFTSTLQNCAVTQFSLVIAHGLTSQPRNVRWVLVCQTSEAGYSAGMEIDVAGVVGGGYGQYMSWGADGTNVWIHANAQTRYVMPYGGGAAYALTSAANILSNWKLKAYCNL